MSRTVGNPETGYTNTDASPTKSYILEARRQGYGDAYWQYCFGKRPQEELFDLENDPDNINNLAGDPDYLERKEALRTELFQRLEQEEDPHMVGQGKVFENYEYARANSRNLYSRFLQGDSTLLWAWIDSTDVEWNRLDSIRKEHHIDL